MLNIIDEFTRRAWLAAVGAQTAFIEPGSPWENGDCESFNSKLRDELLNGEIFYSLAEARIIVEAWRRSETQSDLTHRSDKAHPPEAIIWAFHAIGIGTIKPRR